MGRPTRIALSVLAVWTVLSPRCSASLRLSGAWQDRPERRSPLPLGDGAESARATWARKAPAVLQTEEIVQEFFQRGRRNQSSGWRPPRFQVASSVLVSAGLYAALLRRFLRQRPFGRSVILVPRLSRAREICSVLQEQNLRPLLISHETPCSFNASDQVLVCMHQSSDHLAGFHFDVKIYDEAESLQRPTKTTNKLKNIPAKFVGEFSFTFGSAKVDYKYSVQNAWFEGHLSPVQCFALPLAADSDQRLTWLAHFIQQQQQNWSPMLVLFYQTAAARDFAQRLQSLGVSAEACLPSTKRKGEGSLSNERARADVMCLAKGRAADFALTGLNTVILAEPTRRPRSLCYMQRMMQAQVGRFMPMKLIEVMDGRSRAKMTAYHAHFSHTVGWGIVDTVVDADTGVPRIGGGPQLLDLCGRRFPPSPLNLQHLLKSQVAPQVRSWLQELHAWLQEHQRKPRQSGGLVERLQEARLRRAYHHLRENVLNEEEIKVLAACADLLDSEVRGWIESLARWVEDGSKLPQQQSEDVEERRQAIRWIAAQRCLQLGKLTAAERRLMEQVQVQKMRQWIEDLCAWMRAFGRKPRQRSEDAEERSRANQWKKVQRYLRLGKLTESDQQLLERCAEQVQVAHEPVRLWIQELCAWVEEAGRKPLRMSADANERSQALRWNNARRYLSLGKLTEAEQQLLERCAEQVEHESVREWIRDLCTWVEEAGRKPRSSSEDAEERTRAGQWKAAQRYSRLGKLSESEQQLLERCAEQVAHEPVRQWIQELCAWVEEAGRKPLRMSADATERSQGCRWYKAQRYLRLGKLTESEQQLLERCAEQVQVAHEPVRLWIQELCAWVEEAGRKPLRMYADATERSQGCRWNNAWRYLRLGKLSESEQQLLERCAEQVAHEPVRQCIQELCAWVEETGRKPLRMSADVIERSQASRWNHAQRYLRLGKLTESEQQLLERCAEQVQVAHEPVRLWIEELCAWVNEAGRKPLRMSGDATERSQGRRWYEVQRLRPLGKLREAERDLLESCMPTD